MEIWSKCDICGRDIPVGELCYGLKKGNCICKNCCTGFENCTFTLAPMPTLTQPNEWASAKDNPPQLTGKYICCVEDTHGHMWSIPADYLLEMKTWVGEFGEIKNKVVSWMPLPAPPAKGGDR